MHVTTLSLEQDRGKSAADSTEKAEIRHNSRQLVKHPRLYCYSKFQAVGEASKAILLLQALALKKIIYRKSIDSSRFPAEGT